MFTFVENNLTPKVQLPRDINNIQSFLDIPPVEIARQLTIYEWKIFTQITPLELR